MDYPVLLQLDPPLRSAGSEPRVRGGDPRAEGMDTLVDDRADVGGVRVSVGASLVEAVGVVGGGVDARAL